MVRKSGKRKSLPKNGHYIADLINWPDVSQSLSETAVQVFNPAGPQSFSGVGLTLNGAQFAAGGLFWTSHAAPVTVTVAAANAQRVESILDLGNEIRSLALSKTDTQLRCALHMAHIGVTANGPFHVMPFLAMMENGESVTSTDGNNSNVLTTMDTALGTQTQSRLYGPIKVGKMAYINGTAYWSVDIDFTLTPMIVKYLKEVNKKEFSELSPAYRELYLGVVILARPQGHTVYLSRSAVYYDIPRKADF